MTPVGHTLTGLAIGYAVMPRRFSPRAKAVTLAVFVVLASAPDLPFPYWGHNRYDISHSAFATGVASMVAMIAIGVVLRNSKYFSWPLLVGGVITWCSHILLDTFYNHGRGILVGWPFGKGRVALTIPWFSTMERDPLISTHNLRVWAIEAAVYGALLLAVVIVRRSADNRSTSISN